MSVVEYIDPNETYYPIRIIGVGESSCSVFESLSFLRIKEAMFSLCTKMSKEQKSTTIKPLIMGVKLSDFSELDSLLEDAEMVIIIAFLGDKEAATLFSVIAKKSKEKRIFTLGIVTLPFVLEGATRIVTALNAVDKIKRLCDSLFVINSERISSKETSRFSSLEKKNEQVEQQILNTVKRITDIVTTEGIINCDVAKMHAILSGHTIAVASEGIASGEKRLEKAIKKAIQMSSFLQQDLFSAKKVLFYLFCSDEDSYLLTVEELKDLEFFTTKFENRGTLLWGYSTCKELKEEVRIIIIASGYNTY